MDKDFHVEDACALVHANQRFDLHNQYGFVGLTVCSLQAIALGFRPDSVHGRGLDPVVLEFGGVDYLELCVAREDLDWCDYIDEVGYIGPRDEWTESLMGESQASADDHLFFALAHRGFLRIHARRAELRWGPEALARAGFNAHESTG